MLAAIPLNHLSERKQHKTEKIFIKHKKNTIIAYYCTLFENVSRCGRILASVAGFCRFLISGYNKKFRRRKAGTFLFLRKKIIVLHFPKNNPGFQTGLLGAARDQLMEMRKQTLSVGGISFRMPQDDRISAISFLSPDQDR